MNKRTLAKVGVAGLLVAPLLALAHGPMGASMGTPGGHGMGPLRGLDLTPAQMEKLQAERAQMHTEMQARLRAVLTPEQQKKLDERMSRHPHGPHGSHGQNGPGESHCGGPQHRRS